MGEKNMTYTRKFRMSELFVCREEGCKFETEDMDEFEKHKAEHKKKKKT